MGAYWGMCSSAREFSLVSLLIWGSQLGLTVVPFLPYIFDHPVEEAVDWCFGTALRAYGGEDAVRPLPSHAVGTTANEKKIAVPTASQLSWEEYKQERERARELRRAQNGGSSLTSWLGGLTGSGGSKEKKE